MKQKKKKKRQDLRKRTTDDDDDDDVIFRFKREAKNVSLKSLSKQKRKKKKGGGKKRRDEKTSFVRVEKAFSHTSLVYSSLSTNRLSLL